MIKFIIYYWNNVISLIINVYIKLLILDEPFNGLDKRGAQDVCELFVELKEKGTTILLAAHNVMEMEWLCDTVCEMDAGQLEVVYEK